jgi:Flp pilus assembly protein TadB
MTEQKKFAEPPKHKRVRIAFQVFAGGLAVLYLGEWLKVEPLKVSGVLVALVALTCAAGLMVWNRLSRRRKEREDE